MTPVAGQQDFSRSAAAAAPVPLSPGDLEVQVDVELVYDVAA